MREANFWQERNFDMAAKRTSLQTTTQELALREGHVKYDRRSTPHYCMDIFQSKRLEQVLKIMGKEIKKMQLHH